MSGMVGKLALIGLLGLLAACNREEILTGERVDIRAPWGGDPAAVENRALPIALGAERVDTRWTQRQGTNGARPRNPALADAPQRVWTVSIGAGDSRRTRLATDPVSDGSRIFTLDAQTRVQATSPAGEVLWSADLSQARSARGSASGGALAVGDGRLYVASARAFVAALDTSDGHEIWRTEFDAPVTGSPALAGNSVYVSAADSSLWSLDARTGRIEWTIAGTPSMETLAGGSAPAISGNTVFFPTISGELIAANRINGAIQWTAAPVGRRTGSALATISALSGDPVIDGNRIYVANQSGRTYAIDARSGATIWTADEGAYNPVWPVGGSVFLVSDQNRLIRLDARDGSRIWAVDLPLYTTNRIRRQMAVYPQNGPILAGGRMWVASGDGALRGFDPASGAMTIELDIPGGAASSPIVVNRTLYVEGRDGTLSAYR